MTQPNLSNGESVNCIKKLDMYNTTDQETWSMCFGVVIWKCVEKMHKANSNRFAAH